MKNVLVLIYTPTYGGPHNQVLQLYEPLKKLGWNTIVVLPDTDEASYHRFETARIKVVKKPLQRVRSLDKPKANLQYLFYFRRDVKIIKELITELNIEIVQICGLMHVHAAIAASKVGVPVVWQLLGTFPPKLMRTIFTPIVAHYADSVMTAGHKTAELHPFSYLFRKKHIAFYPPVDTKKFRYDPSVRKKTRKFLKVPEEAILIGTVGNQNKTKSHDEFVQMAKLLTEKYNDIYFRIIGAHTPAHATYYQKNVIALAKHYGLYDHGRFNILEVDIEINQILSAFDIFLLTSYVEGAPTVILEAIATSLPVVSSEVGSVTEIVKNKVHGFTYPFGNIEQAVSHMETLIYDLTLREHIKATNRKEAVEKYDLHACAERHDDAYQQAIIRHSQRRKIKK